MVAALTIFGSCGSSDEAFEYSDVTAAKAEINNKFAKSVVFAKTTPVEPTVKQVKYKWGNDVDIFNFFPEKQTPNGDYSNFLFISNGEPFTLVMLYANGGYRHTLSIYWYDDLGNKFEKEIWSEFNETTKTWINPGGSTTSKTISRLSENAGAYSIQLPEGTKFGFSMHSLTADKKEISEGIREPFPHGDLVAHNYKFYTEEKLNWNYPALESKTLHTQAMTTKVDKWNIIGFEDISLTNPSCDKDFNDCVFAITPVQKVDGDPISDKVEGSVETNLSVTNKNTYDQVRLSIHIRANTDVKVTLPIVDEMLADDFAIVAKHDVEYKYAQAMDVNGHMVQLLYSIDKNGYLVIETKGITKEIIEYCNNTYVDGLTFECNLAFGSFNPLSEPTIEFTKEPYVYKTSCVTNSEEAKDIEVLWDKDMILDLPAQQEGKFVYDHKFYSSYTLEKLKSMGYFQTLK